MNPPVVGTTDITKRYGATAALDCVSFAVMTGEVHALVGKNGAGKSTLVRILGGALMPDLGEIAIDGIPRKLTSPHDAISAGIITIPQELHLVPALSIAEKSHDRRSAAAPPPRCRSGHRPTEDDRGSPGSSGSARLCAGPAHAGRSAQFCRAPARRHRQGAAAALPRAHARRADGCIGEPGNQPVVCRTRSHETPCRHHLHLPSARRDREPRGPLHDLARRPDRGLRHARVVRGR